MTAAATALRGEEGPDFMDSATRARLLEVAGRLSGAEKAALAALLPKAAAEARAISGHWDFGAPSRALDRRLMDLIRFPATAEAAGRTRLRCAAIARMALDWFEVEDRLPGSVLDLYPRFLARLADFVASPGAGEYDENYYAKDVRYALGLTVPCGALQIDLRYRLGPKLIARDLRRGNLPAALAYLGTGAWGRWYNDHLDLRDIAEFTPAGWTAAFARMAEVLALNPDVRGITGVGWIYDPVVAEISPKVAYVRRTQQANGAFMVRIGPGPVHTAAATFKSTTRRRLYESGEYVPTCYAIAWPRRRLIDWARRLKSDPGLAFA